MDSKYKKPLLLLLLFVIALLTIDQTVKIAVKTHMTLNEAIPVFGRWFYINFIENRGAAYGMEIGGSYGKLALSLLRIAAVGAIGWYLVRLVRRGAPRGVIVGVAVVLAGAMGNIIDASFYGLIFSESTPYAVAHFVPWGTGYAPFLHGSVVDMLYFPIIEIERMPSWGPFIHLFQPGFQHCRCLCDVRIRLSVDFPVQIFQVGSTGKGGDGKRAGRYFEVLSNSGRRDVVRRGGYRSKACSISAMISPASSIPTEKRIKSGATPAAISCSSVS